MNEGVSLRGLIRNIFSSIEENSEALFDAAVFFDLYKI